MAISRLVANRSTCLRRHVGAILVKDKRILASGYNGAPSGLKHCEETGCLRANSDVPSGERHELCRGVHAEQNAVIQAAINGTSLQGASLYCTNQPCVICSKILLNAEIKTIYITEHYEDKLAQELLAEAGIEMNVVDRNTGMLKKLF